MTAFQVVYVPIGVGTFHMETAQAQFEASKNLLSSLVEDCVMPEDILLSADAVRDYMQDQEPDLVILQNITFANASYTSEVLKVYDGPLLLWALREPQADGGRLKLNSLTGAFSAGWAVRAFRGNGAFEYVFGSPDDACVREDIEAVIRTAKVKYDLRHLRMAQIGHTPEGFGFGRALDQEIMKTFGVTVLSIEARELMDRARSYSAESVDQYLNSADQELVGLEQTPIDRRLDFGRLLKAYDEYVQENGIGALSSRCWPDFFTDYGTPVCAVLSILNSHGIVSSCEADTYGALSMYIGQQLTGRPAFFGDPVALDEKDNTITFWHCGMGACSLARCDTGAVVGVHPNRKIGPAMDFGLQAARKVTIFRVGRNPDGTFRFFIGTGEALDRPKQYQGTSVVIRMRQDASKIVSGLIHDGFEPHFTVIYGDVKKELEILGRMYGVDVHTA